MLPTVSILMPRRHLADMGWPQPGSNPACPTLKGEIARFLFRVLSQIQLILHSGLKLPMHSDRLH
jgi:hypothetical protein